MYVVTSDLTVAWRYSLTGEIGKAEAGPFDTRGEAEAQAARMNAAFEARVRAAK